MGVQRLPAPEIRHRRREGENLRRAHLGAFRRRQHLPRLPGRDSERGPEHRPVRPRRHRRGNLRFRGHRQGLRPVREPVTVREPAVHRHHRKDRHRVRHGGPEGRLRLPRLAAARGHFPESVPADDFLHHHGEGLYRRPGGPGARPDARPGDGQGRRAAVRALEGRRPAADGAVDGQLLPQRRQGQGRRARVCEALGGRRPRPGGIPRLPGGRDEDHLPLVDDRQDHAAPAREGQGDARGRRLRGQRVHRNGQAHAAGRRWTWAAPCTRRGRRWTRWRR